MKYENDLRADGPMELREAAKSELLDLPVPTEPLASWRGTVSPETVLEFSSQQLERLWSNPEFVRRRLARNVSVPFEM